ncbi:MAG: DUF58 domain-containing protein [Thermomicrobiales bacterium]
MGAAKVGLLVAILFIVAVINDWSSLDLLIIALLILLLIAYFWSRFSLQRLGLTRSLSLDRVRAGESVIEELTLRNASWLPKLWVEVRDLSSLPGHHASRVVHLAGHGEATWRAETLCARRGRYQLGPVRVSSGDPFGLFASHRFIPVRHELVVYPVKLDVSMIHLPAANMSGGAVLNRNAAISSPTIAGLRDYTAGDPLNRISWAATARRGMMMVKEFDPDPTSDLWIMIDLNESGMRPLGDALEPREDTATLQPELDSTEEYLIALGGSLAERALEDGRKVGLIVNRSMPVRLVADNTRRQWYRIFESLAMARPFGNRSLAEAIAVESRRFSRTAGLIVLTASPDRAWVDAARALVQRQVPVGAVVIDDVPGFAAGEDLDRLIEELAVARVSVTRYPIHGAATGTEDPVTRKPA